MKNALDSVNYILNYFYIGKILMCKTASHTAKNLTTARFGNATKVKMNKSEYEDMVKAVYLLAQTNTMKDIRLSVVKAINDDLSLDLVNGDLDIAITNSHNLLIERTKYGKKAFNKMEIEDLIYDTPMDKIRKNNAKLKSNGFR